MKNIRVLGLVTICLLFAFNAFAGNVSITLDGNLNDYVSYSFVDQLGNTQFQYVAPYPVSVSFNNLTGTAALACYDINNPNYLGRTYYGTLAYSTTPAEIEISWLADQVRVTPLSDSATLGALSNAMWELGFPSSTNAEGGYLPIDPAAAPWISLAQIAVANGYKPDTIIFIPDDSNTQRFGFITSTIPLTPSPEPGTLALIGSGVLGMAGILRRKLVG